MQAEHFAAADVSLAQTIVRLLDRLKGRGEDQDLHALLSRGIEHFGCKGVIDEKCARWMNRQLELYAADPLNPVRSRIRARLLQQRLYPYLPDVLDATDDPVVVQPVAKPVPIRPVSENTNDVRFPNEVRNAEVRNAPPPPAATPRNGHAKPERKPDPAKEPNKRPWLDQREALVQRLVETSEKLRSVQAENEQLRGNVAQMEAKARQRKSPKLLTRSSAKALRRAAPMSKRESFLRQLEVEIDRVKRHGTPLALALVDINDLESVDEARGHDAVKAVIKCYINEIFGNFRSYDVVGRYHEDEFAVFFPNTVKDGALRALEKAQKRAAETHFAFEGKAYPLPSFTGSLTHYVTGEDLDTFLARAVDGIIEARGQADQSIVVM